MYIYYLCFFSLVPSVRILYVFFSYFHSENTPVQYTVILRTGHSPHNVTVQPVEKISYDSNSSTRFKNIKQYETELKWIKLLQTPFPLGFVDKIYHEGNTSKMSDFDVLTLLESRKCKSRSLGIRKRGNDKQKR